MPDEPMADCSTHPDPGLGGLDEEARIAAAARDDRAEAYAAGIARTVYVLTGRMITGVATHLHR